MFSIDFTVCVELSIYDNIDDGSINANDRKNTMVVKVWFLCSIGFHSQQEM